MNAFANHFAFEFKTGLRNSTLLMMNYLFPLAFYAMMGLVMTQINPMFTASLVPAMVVFAVMVSTVLGLPSPVVESREAGIYRSYRINGVPAPSILAIPALSTVIHALIVSAIVAATGPILFDGPAPINWLAFAGITLLFAFSSAALGALIGVISSNSRATVLWSQLIFLPSMLLGGMMIPLSMLPATVRPISSMLPAAHAMQAYQGLAYGQETVFNPLFSVGALAASGVLAFGLAIYLFNWDSRNNARRGHPLMALIALAPYVLSIVLG